MKRTDLEKLRGLKINGRMKGAATPERFARDSTGQGQGKKRNPLLDKLLGRAPGTAEPKPEQE